MKSLYCYVCLYWKNQEESSNEIYTILATKNEYAYWFDSTKENFEMKEKPRKIKGKFYTCTPIEIDGVYFAFYPDNEGCPLVNGEGKACLVGGEVKKFEENLLNEKEALIEHIKKSAIEEFWEETGYLLNSTDLEYSIFHYLENDGYGILFVPLSSLERLQEIVTTIQGNLQYVNDSDIPRIKNKDFSIIPRVWSNELKSVELVTVEAALTEFRSMNPRLAGWFVDGLVSQTICICFSFLVSFLSRCCLF
jgi:8-oxo-dGTP pyrophosphatase MutT (NUDIX family)